MNKFRYVLGTCSSSVNSTQQVEDALSGSLSCPVQMSGSLVGSLKTIFSCVQDSQCKNAVTAVRVLVRSMEDPKRPLTDFSRKHKNADASLVNLMSSNGGRSCTHGNLWHQCCTGCPRRLSGTWHVINSHYDETMWDTKQCIHQVWIRVLVLRTEVKHSSHTLGIHFMMFSLNVVRISVSVANDCGDIVCDPLWCLTD